MDKDPLNELTEKIIGCAIEVHRVLGPGLLESIYEKALCEELREAGLEFKSQVVVPVIYKGKNLGEQRIDLLVQDEVVVEVKSTEGLGPLVGAQVLTYLRVAGKRMGLALNFNSKMMKEGGKRIVLGL